MPVGIGDWLELRGLVAPPSCQLEFEHFAAMLIDHALDAHAGWVELVRVPRAEFLDPMADFRASLRPDRPDDIALAVYYCVPCEMRLNALLPVDFGPGLTAAFAKWGARLRVDEEGAQTGEVSCPRGDGSTVPAKLRIERDDDGAERRITIQVRDAGVDDELCGSSEEVLAHLLPVRVLAEQRPRALRPTKD